MRRCWQNGCATNWKTTSWKSVKPWKLKFKRSSSFITVLYWSGNTGEEVPGKLGFVQLDLRNWRTGCCLRIFANGNRISGKIEKKHIGSKQLKFWLGKRVYKCEAISLIFNRRLNIYLSGKFKKNEMSGRRENPISLQFEHWAPFASRIISSYR